MTRSQATRNIKNHLSAIYGLDPESHETEKFSTRLTYPGGWLIDIAERMAFINLTHGRKHVYWGQMFHGLEKHLGREMMMPQEKRELRMTMLGYAKDIEEEADSLGYRAKEFIRKNLPCQSLGIHRWDAKLTMEKANDLVAKCHTLYATAERLREALYELENWETK